MSLNLWTPALYNPYKISIVLPCTEVDIVFLLKLPTSISLAHIHISKFALLPYTQCYI